MASDIGVALIGGGTALVVAVVGVIGEYLRRPRPGPSNDAEDEAVVTTMAKRLILLEAENDDLRQRLYRCEARERARE